MCLYSNTPIPSIAQEDIICYKLFKFNRKILHTPYQHAFVMARELPCMMIAEGPKYVDIDELFHKYTITSGFIHAFTKNETELRRILWSSYSNYTIVLCKIPKGTKYYVDCIRDTICASQMKLIRILNKDKFYLRPINDNEVI